MNLTNLEETPLHAAFEACVESASKRGLRVTGSEVVGMLPKKCLVDAGRYFLRKQKWSEGASEEELIDVAIRSMGLSELKPFDPKERIIELKMESDTKKSLVKMDLRQFCNETLSDSPAPGGGSVAALMGRLSVVRRDGGTSPGETGWDDKIQYFSEWAVSAAAQGRDAFLSMKTPPHSTKSWPHLLAQRFAGRESGAFRRDPISKQMRPDPAASHGDGVQGLRACKWRRRESGFVSDVGVGALAVRACIEGAAMNVRINLAGLRTKLSRLRFGKRCSVCLLSPRLSSSEFTPLWKASSANFLLRC
jgi:glutamate formiminotransferase/formiminotetrahydrofolate cyclodeaminase